MIFCAADFSTNFNVRSSKLGSMSQFREFAEASLESFICYKYIGDKLKQWHYHYICQDPKHNVHIHAKNLEDLI